MIVIIAGTVIASLCGLGLFLYFMQKGQFDDDEEVKYQVFKEDEL